MALRSELKELLSGFEKRMKFINIVRCLLEYRYPDEIRAMIPEKRILDNVIVAVLVYIKDRTLGTDQRCTMSDIENFVEDFSVVLPDGENIDASVLARYIIVDVLQNGGVLTEFLTFNSESESFDMMPVRLINEEKNSYHLTDDAFDFLFRSKEIESELDYSITRFRMKEYMKRDNYEEALSASRELVSRIRNMKISMDDFLQRCREDISGITVDQYENVILRIRTLLESEYKELTDIQDEAKERERLLEDAQEKGVSGEDVHKNRMALREIIKNISDTIEEQRILINKKTSLADSYQALIRDNFAADRFKRLNFEKEIMRPLRSMGDQLGDAANFLLFMLTKPVLKKHFSIESFYASQSKLDERNTETGIDMSSEASDQMQLINIRNRRNQHIIFDLFKYAQDNTRFKISDFVYSLRCSVLVEYCEENALANIILALFSMQVLDIEGWKNSDHMTVIPDGEFELAWCLEELPGDFLNMRKIIFRKTDSQFSFTAEIDGNQHRIDMTDFEVEVIV